MKKLIITIVSILQLVALVKAQNTHDCLGAISLCGSSYNQPSTINNVGNIPNEINVSPTSNQCLTAESGGIWYTFTPSTTDTLRFSIIPTNPSGEDYDWALFDLTGASCSDLATGDPFIYLVAGNTAGDDNGLPPFINNGSTGVNGDSAVAGSLNCVGPGPGDGSGTGPNDWNAFNSDVIVQAGNTYYLYVAQFSGSQGYTLDFSASQASLYDAIPPNLVSASPTNCSGTTIQFLFSENITCSSLQSNEFTITGSTGITHSISAITSPTCGIGGTSDSLFTATVSPAMLQNGTYTFSFDSLANGSVQDACGNLTSPSNVVFTINATPPSLISASSTNCDGTTVQFEFSENVTCSSLQNNEFSITGPTGTLHTISGITSPVCGIGGTSDSLFTATVSPAMLQNGTYTFIFDSLANSSVQDTCGHSVSSTDVVFTITNIVDATITQTQVGPFCDNVAPFNLLSANGGGVWSGTGITDSLNGTFNPAVAENGTHLITYTMSSFCNDTDTISLTVIPVDSVGFSYNLNYCLTDTVNPTPINTGTLGGIYSIDNSGVIDANAGEINLIASGSGNFVVTYTTSGSCQNSGIFNLTINPCTLPVVTFTATKAVLCINDCTDFNDLTTELPIDWRWYFFDASPSTSSYQHPSNICYNTVGTFPVALVSTNIYGTDSLYIPNYIVVDSCLEIPDTILIPNVFSPNGDGKNDVFNLSGYDIDLVEMSIFNRWGALVFNTEMTDNGWDGQTTSGTAATEGTYFYVIIVNLNQATKTYKGTLTLIR